MLQLGPNLNLDWPVPRRGNNVYGPVPETWHLSPIDKVGVRECTHEAIHDLILRSHIRHYQPAARDVLHLGQPDFFAAKLFRYGSRGFRSPSSRLQLRRIPDNGYD